MQVARWLAASLIVILAACNKKGGAGTAGSASVMPTGTAAPSASMGTGAIPCENDSNKKTRADDSVWRCKLTRDHSLDGYTCEGGKMIDTHPGGKLAGCSLKTPTKADGWSCKEAFETHPSGKLKRCRITELRTVTDIAAPPGAWVSLYGGGGLQRLEVQSGSVKIQGLSCQGYLNYFHENGKLKKCELAEGATVEGKKLTPKDAKGAQTYVCFDEKGKRVGDCNLLSGM